LSFIGDVESGIT